DPLVAGVDDLRQVVVGEHFFRQVAAGAGNPRINAMVRGLLAHVGAALTWTRPAHRRTSSTPWPCGQCCEACRARAGAAGEDQSSSTTCALGTITCLPR